MDEPKTEIVSTDFSIEYILPDIDCPRPVGQLAENLKRKVECIESLAGLEEDGVRQVKRTSYATEKLDLDCEWNGCSFNTDKFASLMAHVRGHLPEVEIKKNPVLHQDVFVCLWMDCYYESPVSEEMARHVNYHSFHTKLKSHGLNMIQREGLKGCTLDIGQRNIFPDIGDNFKCEWADCEDKDANFTNPALFYQHVDTHLESRQLDCKWGHCFKRDLASLTRLREHVRSHTQERLIACPGCGALFANRVKLLDHLKRQQRGGCNNRFVCTSCNKAFALERLLKNHMRSHINHYSCPQCGMAWPTPSTLATHIKYRHNGSRDFACESCDHKAKSHADLKQHARIHQGDVLSCPKECGYVCKSNASMKSHYLKKHMNEGNMYACHLCDKSYARGQFLTTHLKKKHQVTSTTSRFRYSLDDNTGMYHAQLIRFEIQDEDVHAEAVDDPDQVNAQEEEDQGGEDPILAPSSYRTESVASSPASQRSHPFPSSPHRTGTPNFPPAYYGQLELNPGSITPSTLDDAVSQASTEDYSVSVFPPLVDLLVTSSPIKRATNPQSGEVVSFFFNDRRLNTVTSPKSDIEIDITEEQFEEHPRGDSVDGDPNGLQDSIVADESRTSGAKMSELSLFMSTISNMFPGAN